MIFVRTSLTESDSEQIISDKQSAADVEVEAAGGGGVSSAVDVSLFLPLVSKCAKQREEQVRAVLCLC